MNQEVQLDSVESGLLAGQINDQFSFVGYSLTNHPVLLEYSLSHFDFQLEMYNEQSVYVNPHQSGAFFSLVGQK